MKKERKPITWKHYVFCAVAAVVLFVLVLWREGLFTGEVSGERALFRVLSDAFLIPGSLLVLIGGALLFYQIGVFDGITYMAKQFADAMKSATNRQNRYKNTHVQTFAEYVEARDAAPRSPCRHFLITGGICMALCVLFMVLNMVVA